MTKQILYKRWEIVAAAVIGFGAGTWSLDIWPLKNNQSPNQSTISGTSAPIDDDTARMTPKETGTTAASQLKTTSMPKIPEENSIIFGPSGIRLIPARTSQNFVGYRVLESSADRRISIGDIITAINGTKVEDSAAGSELLLAALADSSSRIEIAADLEIVE